GGVSARSALAACGASLRADGDGAGRFFLLLVVFLRMRRVGGVLVDAAFGERRQLLVRRLLLVQRLLQQLDGIGVPHRLGPGDQRAVGGHLVVLGALAGRDQAGVHRGLVEVLFHDRLTIFYDFQNAVAVFAAHLPVEAL